MRIIACLLLAFSALGQTGPELPRFDVVSVRPPNGFAISRIGCNGDRFVFSGIALTWLIRWAYDLPASRIQGLPNWVTDWVNKPDSMFQIEAKASEPVNKEQCKAMVRSLLADRFKMSAHLEPKEIRAYALTVSKKGIKMHEVSPDAPGPGVFMNKVPFRVGTTDPSGKVTLPPGISMSLLADQLSNSPVIAAPVIDKTGLKGIYSFALESSGRDDDGLPSIWVALPEQLGLKLEPTKAVMSVLVVDHIEKPVPN